MRTHLVWERVRACDRDRVVERDPHVVANAAVSWHLNVIRREYTHSAGSIDGRRTESGIVDRAILVAVSFTKI